jgi:hypothetical protein
VIQVFSVDSSRVASGVCALAVVMTAGSAFAATRVVPGGGDLQGALNAANPGDVIELEAGEIYTGNFKLPVKNGDEFIVVRTGGSGRGLPGPGVRVTPAHAALLAKIRSGNSSSALTTAPGAHHWRFELVEFQGTTKGNGDIIALGAGSSQTEMSQMPHDLVFDRVYVHGDPTVGQKRGIALNSASTHIINSYFEDFKLVGQEAQAIAGWNGAGPYLIENNYAEGAAQSFILGGSDPSVPNLVPSDVTVRRNVFTKPLEWRNEKWLVKNAFELKNARRVLVEGNVMENVWAGGQNGYAVLFTVRNQNGRAPWSTVEDVTFRYNIIRHAGAAINVLGHDDSHPSQQVKRLRISHNLVYDIDRSVWGGNGDFIQLGAMPRDIYIEQNTVMHDGAVLRVYGGKTPTGGVTVEGLVFRNNVMRHNQYGVKGDGMNSGNSTFGKYLPAAVFERNVLAGGPVSQYPGGNYFPSVADFDAQFVDAANENFALVPGSSFGAASTQGSALGADLRMMQGVMGGSAPVNPPVAPVPGDVHSESPTRVRRAIPRVTPRG